MNSRIDSEVRDQVQYLMGEIEGLKLKNKNLEDLISKQGKYLNTLQQDMADND